MGAGIEFADHRDYTPGDDLRYLDWNLYGRMQRLLVRLFEEDEDLSIYVLFDASASMGTGTPPKLDLAMQVGAARDTLLANLDVCRCSRWLMSARGCRWSGQARILPCALPDTMQAAWGTAMAQRCGISCEQSRATARACDLDSPTSPLQTGRRRWTAANTIRDRGSRSAHRRGRPTLRGDSPSATWRPRGRELTVAGC